MQFEKQEVSCLMPCLSRVQTLEQTQEIPLPEGGEGRILGTWGQSVMRTKEWMGSSILLTGGVQIWVLYETEDGAIRCLNSWIPYRMDWDLPDGTEEGWVRIRTVMRSADARPISAGKLLIRVGIAAQVEAYCPFRTAVYAPQEISPELELLRSQWPVRLRKESGEKAFELEETVSLPGSVPPVDRLLSWQLDTKVTDQKILGDKIVFRGVAILHVVYLSPEGQLRCWDFELPFSQYDQLKTSHSADARADVAVAVTRLELEQEADGRLNLRAGFTGQYLVDDRKMLETVEDAFCPHREVTVQQDKLQLPVLLDNRQESVQRQISLPVCADVVADQVFYPEFPRQRREGQKVCLSQSGMLQVLYYDGNGSLQSSVTRIEGETDLALDEGTELTAVPVEPQLQIHPGRDAMDVRLEVPLQTVSTVRQEFPMVTDLKIGEKSAAEEGRPSLILCRAGSRRLWDIARENGSTVSAIRNANNLTGELEKDRMLLIPVV